MECVLYTSWRSDNNPSEHQQHIHQLVKIIHVRKPTTGQTINHVRKTSNRRKESIMPGNRHQANQSILSENHQIDNQSINHVRKPSTGQTKNDGNYQVSKQSIMLETNGQTINHVRKSSDGWITSFSPTSGTETPSLASSCRRYFSMRDEKSLYRLSTAAHQPKILLACKFPLATKSSANCSSSLTFSLVSCIPKTKSTTVHDS